MADDYAAKMLQIETNWYVFIAIQLMSVFGIVGGLVAYFGFGQLGLEALFSAVNLAFHMNLLWSIIYFKAPKYSKYVFVPWFMIECIGIIVLQRTN